ncbi:MAG: CBS domain-containing protein [Myxococcota bacterium]
MAGTLITTHENADLDALASAVAAQKLHPGAQLGLGRRVAPGVRRFLALHRRRFPVARCSALDLETFDELVVTDVRRSSRLRHVAPLLARAPAKEVWDHHPPANDDIRADLVRVEAIGAATTLLCEALFEEGIPLDPIEATLFALGIHADTGGFTYAQTTPRDVHAYGRLLAEGAVVSALRRFLDPPLDPNEQSFLQELLQGLEPAAYGVGMTQARVPKRLGGVARLVEELLHLSPYEAVFAVLEQGPNVQLIGRARGSISVDAILRHFGGGGHPGAGAALVRRQSTDRVRRELASRLCRTTPRPTRDAMQQGVFTLTRDVTLARARSELRARRYSGAPVVDPHGLLAGMISLRDIERALRKSSANIPVAGCMTHDVISVEPSTPLGKTISLMESRDIGRVPVLDGDRIVGIVTRSDVLRILYP